MRQAITLASRRDPLPLHRPTCSADPGPCLEGLAGPDECRGQPRISVLTCFGRSSSVISAATGLTRNAPITLPRCMRRPF